METNKKNENELNKMEQLNQKAMNLSIKYFDGDELPANIFVNKYALRNHDMELQEFSPEDMHKRIAKEFARIEKKKFKKPYSEKEIFSFLHKFKKIIPQGSPMYGIGNPYQIVSISNCFVVEPPEDSYGSICKADQQIVQISKRRGGIGIDISKLRPKGTPTRNAAKTSTGIIPFLERYSRSIREVGQSGRRGAAIVTLSVHHPEIINFINVKQDLEKVTGANISIRLTDEFLKAVKENKTYELRWPVDSRETGKEPKVSMEVEASQIWKKIINSAWKCAEPGILMWDNILKESPADCYSDSGFKTISTNPSLKGDTLVLTNDGVRSIKWLSEKCPNPKVLNIRGEWCNCNVFKSGKDKQLVKINFKNNQSVYCTKEHKWPIIKKEQNKLDVDNEIVNKKTAIQLKSGDKIYLPNFKSPINANALRGMKKEHGFLIGVSKKDTLFPKTIWIGEHDFIRGYIDGIFSSMGKIVFNSKTLNSEVSLSSFNEKFINNVQKLLCFYGIRSNKKQKKNKTKKNSEYILSILGIHVKYFFDVFTISDLNKKNDIKRIKKFFQANKIDDERYLEISNIEITDIKEDVYDITVHDDTHTFLMESGITGNCSEIPLCALDSCRLLVINLFHCVKNPFTSKAYFDFNKLKETSYFAQRLMDDLVDIESECIDKIINKIIKDPEDEETKRVELQLWKKVKTVCENGRRTGTGITAMGDVMAALGLQYASDDSIDLAEKIHKIIKLSAYRCSVDMAKEIGSFSCYDYKKEEKCSFIQRIAKEDPVLYEDMKKYGRRNIALLTIAPTGSVSILTQTTSGIEPLFQMQYTRRRKVNPNDTSSRIDFVDKSGDKWQEYPVFHPGIKKWANTNKKFIKDKIQKLNISKENKICEGFLEDGSIDFENKKIINIILSNSPWVNSCAEDLNWKKRILMQSKVQKHVDHSISTTINVPNNATEEQISEIYQEAWDLDCKGITVYRSGSRDGVLISKSSNELNSLDFDNDGILKTNSAKRPKSVLAEMHHTTVRKMRYYVVVGFKGNDPFEVFAGINHDDDGEIVIPKTVSKGAVVKKSRGKYIFIDDKKGIEYKLTNGESNDSVDALTRAISLALRHGAGIQYVVSVLEKTKGNMTSFSKAMARALKKYIPNNTKVSGEECQVCGSSELVRQEGCISCKKCGWSKCL